MRIVAHASGKKGGMKGGIKKGGIMQRTHVLRKAMPPTAGLLVCFVSATSIGVAVGDLEHAIG